MPINEKNRLGQLGKRRLFLSVIFAASAGCIVWFTAHPPKQHAPESPVSESAETDTDAVPFYSLNLTAAARSNLAREFSAYNVSYAPQNYYTMLGTLRDASGAVIYGTDTLARAASEKSYLNQRNRLCMYLYGDRESRADAIIGPEALMRTAKGESPVFVTGDSLQLSIRSDLEEPICNLLFDNGISGGCIMQDTKTGRIEVLTATSIAGDNQSDTVWEALHQEKSGLSQLESCLDASAVRDFGLSDADAAAYFDYHALSSVRNAKNPDTGNIENVERWHFMTDFDLLDESADGKISPLHLNSVTQRIFSGYAATPTLIAAYLRPDQQQEITIPQEPKCGVPIPQEIINACQARYQQTEQTDSASLQYRTDELHDFLYITGRIVSNDGSIDKCFTLYARNPVGEDTRNRCILQLPKCIAYYLMHAGTESAASDETAPAVTDLPDAQETTVTSDIAPQPIEGGTQE